MKRLILTIAAMHLSAACDNLESTKIDSRTGGATLPESGDLNELPTQSNGTSEKASGKTDSATSTNTNTKASGTTDSATSTSTNTNANTSTTTPFKATSIAEGFGWLSRSSNTNKAYRATTDLYYLPYNLSETVADRMAGVLNEKRAPSENRMSSDIRNWNRRPSNCLLELEQEHSGALADVVLTDCHSPNRYGIQNCPKPEEQFLGVRDVRGFKNAFGVRLSCKGIVPYSLYRYANDAGEPYHTVRDVWLHPDSNHPYRVVSEGGATFTRTNTGLSFSEALAVRAAFPFRIASYENYTPVSAGPIKDIFVSYQVVGPRIRFQGLYISEARCGTYASDRSKIGGLFFRSISIGSWSQTENSLVYLDGFWESNQTQSGGVGGARFRNYDGRKVISPPDISYEPTEIPGFFKVSVNNGSPVKTTEARFYNGPTVSNFKQPFFCFSNQVLDFKNPIMRNLEPL